MLVMLLICISHSMVFWGRSQLPSEGTLMLLNHSYMHTSTSLSVPKTTTCAMLMTFFISLLYSTVFWIGLMAPACEATNISYLDRYSQAVDLYAGITIGSIQNVMGVLYSSTNYQGMFNLQNVLPVVGYERSVFYR